MILSIIHIKIIYGFGTLAGARRCGARRIGKGEGAGMETRQLKYFLDVANCLNFTKAAQQNHIAQTAMSQNIISLENQLGFKLFNRNNRNVSLTHMGEHFYREAMEIYRTVERAEAHMRNIASGSEGVIRLGFQGEHESNFLPKVIRRFRARHPGVTLELLQDVPGRLERMLELGETDIIFNIQYQETAVDAKELVIQSQPLCLAAPPEHPLAKAEHISRAQLSDEPMVFINPTAGESIYHYMIHDSLQSGFSPRIVGYASTVYALLLMVACGIGITVLPENCAPGNQDVVFVPLEEKSHLNVVARWKPGNDNAALWDFVKILEEMFAQ